MNDIYYRIRTLIEKTPRVLLIIIALSIIVLIPFPETLTGVVTLVKFEPQEVCAIGQLPYQYINLLKEGTNVVVKLEGFTTTEAGKQDGYITHIDAERNKTPEGTFFSYSILLNNDPFMHKDMKGEVSIALPCRNLLIRSLELFGR